MNNKIMAAVAAALIGVSFYAGVTYDKSTAPAAPVRAGGNFTGARGGRGMGGVAAGQVLSVDATGFTVKMQDGSSRIVLVGSSTQVMKSVAGMVTDLAQGENVVVQGSSNSDGSVTAQTVQIRPAGSMPGSGRQTQTQ